jgi:hypothetical protein
LKERRKQEKAILIYFSFITPSPTVFAVILSATSLPPPTPSQLCYDANEYRQRWYMNQRGKMTYGHQF